MGDRMSIKMRVARYLIYTWCLFFFCLIPIVSWAVGSFWPNCKKHAAIETATAKGERERKRHTRRDMAQWRYIRQLAYFVHHIFSQFSVYNSPLDLTVSSSLCLSLSLSLCLSLFVWRFVLFLVLGVCIWCWLAFEHTRYRFHFHCHCHDSFGGVVLLILALAKNIIWKEKNLFIARSSSLISECLCGIPNSALKWNVCAHFWWR